jgi:hypothetical protein
MPKVQSSVYPDRAISFNEWQQDLRFEREVERFGEDLKREIVKMMRDNYYATK